jgi:hypothetical protein
LTGCSKSKETTFATTEMAVVEEDSIPKNENYEIGKVIKENDSCAKMSKNDSSSKKKSSK